MSYPQHIRTPQELIDSFYLLTTKKRLFKGYITMMETHDIFYEFGRRAGNEQGAGYAMEAGIYYMAKLANAGVLNKQQVRYCLTFVLKQFGDNWGWSGEIEDALSQIR